MNIKAKLELEPKVDLPEEALETLATLARRMMISLYAHNVTFPVKLTISYSGNLD